ncbi:HU family DNA-binding protein [Vibrio sinensis]|uniref:HU family DNA-binding protein n=1 Tax=Vibrio sinensis TaxID=2302434 RepID=A0A3A6QLK1_9VIBR|nr:HU family DNA-binding protein [Vibrio sinensis]RJX68658.1 HU family DNA-binding protein [Vibrio sinensis]
MNKTELVAHIAETAELTKIDAGRALDAILNGITESLANGDEVALMGFGTFKISARAARDGRNPRTGETVKIAASKLPSFKAGKTFKDAVNQ